MFVDELFLAGGVLSDGVNGNIQVRVRVRARVRVRFGVRARGHARVRRS